MGREALQVVDESENHCPSLSRENRPCQEEGCLSIIVKQREPRDARALNVTSAAPFQALAEKAITYIQGTKLQPYLKHKPKLHLARDA